MKEIKSYGNINKSTVFFTMLKENLKNLSLLEDLLIKFLQEEREPSWPPAWKSSSPGTSAGPPPPRVQKMNIPEQILEGSVEGYT
jgi:hypothetical protein